MDRRYAMVGAVAAMVGGLALIGGGVFELMDYGKPERPLSEEALDPAFALGVAPFVVGAVALSIALPVLHLRQAARAGAVGTGAFVLASLGLAFMVAFSFIFAFVVPTIAKSAPEFLDQEDPGAPLSYLFMIGFPVFMLGMLAFGGVVAWAKAFPAWMGWLLVGGTALDFVRELVDVPFSGALLMGTGFIALGWTVWHGRSVPAETAVPSAPA